MSTIINGTSSAITFPDSSVQNTAALTTGGTIASATITALSTSGITFPATQVPSADANTLDDYEEGTWTPVVTSLSGSITSYAASGKYTKIGNVVTLWYYITIATAGTASGKAQISGAPFTANYGTSIAQPASVTRESSSTGYMYFTYIIGGDTILFMQNSTNGAIGWGNGYSYSGIQTYQSA